MRWAEDLDETVARDAVAAAEASPANPAKHETKVKGTKSGSSVPRVTPLYALMRNSDGTYDIGIPEDGWSEAAIRAQIPAVTIVDNRAPGKDQV